MSVTIYSDNPMATKAEMIDGATKFAAGNAPAITTLTITPDTTIWTLNADFAGYSYLDGIMGDQSAATWFETAQSNGDTEEQDINSLCGWFDGVMSDPANGYWFSEQEADAFIAEQREEGSRVVGTPKSFTPRSAIAAIYEIGRKEIADRDSE